MGDFLRPVLSGRLVRASIVAATMLVLSLAACASPALAGAWWRLSSRAAPSNLQPGQKAVLEVRATDVGDVGVNATSKPVTITDTLPPNLEAIRISGRPAMREEEAEAMSCEPPTQARSVSCTTQAETFPPFEALLVTIEVNVKAQAGMDERNEVSVQGGEQEGRPGVAMPSVPAVSQPLTVSGQPTVFGVEEGGYALTPELEGGELDRQAGSHPFQLTTALKLNETTESVENREGRLVLAGAAPALPKQLSFNLPPGLIGDPRAVAPCSSVEFYTINLGGTNDCPLESAIGVAVVTLNRPAAAALGSNTFVVPLWNLEPANGEPARLGFEVVKVPVVLDTLASQQRRLWRECQRQQRTRDHSTPFQRSHDLGRARRSQPRPSAWLGMCGRGLLGTRTPTVRSSQPEFEGRVFDVAYVVHRVAGVDRARRIMAV